MNNIREISIRYIENAHFRHCESRFLRDEAISFAQSGRDCRVIPIKIRTPRNDSEPRIE